MGQKGLLMDNNLPKKNSFILYCDQSELIQKLSDEQAGILIKLVYDYCDNVMTKPEISDPLVDIVFTSLRTSIDRDYKKYERIVKRNRDNGRLGGRPSKPKKPSGLSGNPKNPSEPDSDSDSGRDSDSEEPKKENTPIVPEKKTQQLNFKDYLQEKIIENNFIGSKDKIFEFYKYRMEKAKAKQYKTEKGLNGLFRDLNGCRSAGLIVTDCLEIAMEKNWQTPDPSYFKNGNSMPRAANRSEQNTQTCKEWIDE